MLDTAITTTQGLNVVARKKTALPSDAVGQSMRATLRVALTELEQLVVPELVSAVNELGEAFDRFAVRVSLIGQVKAGKTALCNAFLGQSGLLPSDINPWTSVVTSVHVNQPAPRHKRAVFKFFTRSEWDSMVETGGRIAKMVADADMPNDVDDLRQQIVEMQEKTKARLGRNFELLLNNQHAFSEFSADLIRRYVCLGDAETDTDPEGKFADMTRSADLYIDSDHFDYPITLIDTPGVNDPFLMREAVTLESLGNSDICVIVLSAHQALSTSDLALMRILLGLKQKQIVLFINRVDELNNPKSQIEEIREKILKTLAKQDIPNDLPIVFGSAVWANAHVNQSLGELSENSLRALTVLSQTQHDDLSGMSELHAALNEKAFRDVSAPYYSQLIDVCRAAAQQSRKILSRAISSADVEQKTMPPDAVEEAFKKLRQDIENQTDGIRKDFLDNIRMEYSRIFQEFIFQESRSISKHLESGKSISTWNADVNTLRNQLNARYSLYSADASTTLDFLGRRIVEDIESIYSACGEDKDQIGIYRPAVSEVKTPIALMRTMSIDFSESWLSRWFKRREKPEHYIKALKEMANAQLVATVEEIESACVNSLVDRAKLDLLDLCENHAFALNETLGLDNLNKRSEYRERLERGQTLEHRVQKLTNLISVFDDVERRIENLSAS